MKKMARVGALIKILSDSPNRSFPLKYFCDLFDAAKSSISEDIQTAKELVCEMRLGTIDTVAGAGGGVKFIPTISAEGCAELQRLLCEKLSDKNRILGGGFLYTSDIMFDPAIMKRTAAIFAHLFQNTGADYVATIETKGIPAAFMTAHLLNLPLIVVRRESKVSEGSTVSINYFSGSADRVQRMSVAKRAALPGTRAIIIDDFMRGGGSIKGITEILTEFDVHVVGSGVVIASTIPEQKKVTEYSPIIFLGNVDEIEKNVETFPNSQIF